jgi:hypothetical protein
VATFLARDPQVAACLLPFPPMRRNAAPPRAKLSQQMSQFVSQGAVNLRRIFTQQRI